MSGGDKLLALKRISLSLISWRDIFRHAATAAGGRGAARPRSICPHP